MKKSYTSFILAIILVSMAVVSMSCSKQDMAGGEGAPEVSATVRIEQEGVLGNENMAYIPVVNTEVSSFDVTPDWAPEPNPMATVDGDMLTRWSSDYSAQEQWISLDLGQESVVNSVVIKWERAYATRYDILVSMDGENWTLVHSEKNGQGGTVTASFPEAKCRYVKIMGIEKVNSAWGISIWEIEIYGPEKHNPHALVSQKDYVQNTEKDDIIEEAEKLINEVAQPLVAIADKSFQKGVVYTSWMAEELLLSASDLMLAKLKKSGFDTVAIMVPAYQDDLDSANIYTNDVPNGDTPTEEALKHAVEVCHKLGLRVMIKPHVDPRTDEARINIRPSSAWFDSYEEFILRYACFCQENNVEMFSIGTELEATTFETWAKRWNQVIDKVKENYEGVLTYSANWTEYKEVPFWDKMDFIGIDAYFPLTETNNPTKDQLKRAWEDKADEIDGWLVEKGLVEKGLLFTEIGYPSSDGANRQPWVAITSVEDEQEQADCLSAMFEVMLQRPWFKGYYIWQYFPQERWSPLGFTVKGKKAEQVINSWIARG
ncbi:MAG: discoidin domain-containing protein [Candidatus Omnitrophica bacterium]|nr:discoidin domain-containing protein [Candidatus Omnitrophota bacterium]